MGPGQFSLDRFLEAADRIRPYVKRTSLVELAPGVLAKAEQMQVTGSFKVRGALNKILSLPESRLERGIICASAGNHGLGVAYACELRGARCTVVLPRSAVAKKVESIRKHGATVIKVDGGYGEAEVVGRQMAQDEEAVWVSPYNDPEIVLGQGTIGLEIFEQLGHKRLENLNIFLPTSGGGLLCGVGLAVKQLTDCRVYGVQTEAAPYLFAQFTQGSMRDVRERPTVADGLAGPVEENAITMEYLKKCADDVLLVAEDDIAPTVRWLAELGHLVEPSAAVAAAPARRSPFDGLAVVVLSGGNAEDDMLKKMLEGT